MPASLAPSIEHLLRPLQGRHFIQTNPVLLPNQPDPTILDVAQKLDELILALRR
jgi:hypothetical protein